MNGIPGRSRTRIVPVRSRLPNLFEPRGHEMVAGTAFESVAIAYETIELPHTLPRKVCFQRAYRLRAWT